MGYITVNELIDRANGYKYGIAEFHMEEESRGMKTSINFNEVKEDGNSVVFQQINWEDVRTSFPMDTILSVEDLSKDGCEIFEVKLKTDKTLKVFLFNEKGGEAQACHFLYDSYDDYLKVLDMNSLKEKVGKTKKTFVSVSDGSTSLHQTYNNIILEAVEDEDGGAESYRLVFFNGDRDDSADRLIFTFYEDALNDIWLMGGAPGWEGLKLRLYGQPFAEIRVSLMYK